MSCCVEDSLVTCARCGGPLCYECGGRQCEQLFDQHGQPMPFGSDRAEGQCQEMLCDGCVSQLFGDVKAPSDLWVNEHLRCPDHGGKPVERFRDLPVAIQQRALTLAEDALERFEHNERDCITADSDLKLRYVSFEFEGVDVYYPFWSISTTSEVDPVEYYGQAFLRSAFCQLAELPNYLLPPKPPPTKTLVGPWCSQCDGKLEGWDKISQWPDTCPHCGARFRSLPSNACVVMAKQVPLEEGGKDATE